MKKIILDLDTGIDDTFALSYSIKNPNLNLVGVTTIFGNVDVNTSIKNTKNVMNLLKKDIPVYKGEHQSYDNPYFRRDIVKRIHGDNGIGNIELTDCKKREENMSAIEYLKKVFQSKTSEDYVIVFTGPLTNLAKLIEKYPHVVNTKATIAIMGGVLRAKGNASLYAEANILEDAKAAKIVFESALKLKVFGLNVTHKVIFNEQDFSENENREQKFFSQLASYYCKNTIGEKNCCYIHDAVALICSLYPSFASFENVSLSVITTGEKKGMLEETSEKRKNIEYYFNVDSEKVRKEFLDTIKL